MHNRINTSTINHQTNQQSMILHFLRLIFSFLPRGQLSINYILRTNWSSRVLLNYSQNYTILEQHNLKKSKICRTAKICLLSFLIFLTQESFKIIVITLALLGQRVNFFSPSTTTHCPTAMWKGHSATKNKDDIPKLLLDNLKLLAWLTASFLIIL